MDVVGMVVHDAANVLPHYIDHGRSKKAVLNIERIQPKVTILEDLADVTFATTVVRGAFF